MSKKNTSMLGSAAGFVATFNHQLFAAIKKAGIPDEQAYDLLKAEDPGFIAKLVKVFEESAGMPAGTFDQMLAACRFQYVNPNINERNFPIAGPVADVEDMEALSWRDLGSEGNTTSEIEVAIERGVYRRATFAEQIVYARRKWNGRGLIVALGSSWVRPGVNRNVPCLYEGAGGRELVLYWAVPGDRWREADLFLVVRK